MKNSDMKGLVYKVFSDSHMIILAFVALIVLMLEFFNVSQTTFEVLVAITWLIWLAFLVEFALKLYVEKNKSAYIGAHKFDSILSLVIIITPIAALIFNIAFASSSVLRLVRISTTISNSTLVSGAAYGSKAGVKTNKVEEKDEE